MRKHSLSVIAAAVFAALSTAAVAQTTQQRQSTGASQSSQTNPEQVVAPSAATGVDASVGFRGNHNTIYMDSQATTNQSTSASQTTGSTQGLNVSPSQNPAAAGGAVGSKVDMSDGPGKRGKGKAKGHEHAPGQNR